MAKTIIIKDADYSVSKVDTVTFGNVDPAFVVVGGFNARLSSGGVYNENITTSYNNGKYGIVVANNSDTNLKTWDRSGGSVNDGDFRFVPIMLPTGAKKITLKSKVYKNDTLIGFKTRFLFCDSTQSPSGYVGVKCVDGKTNNNWDQSDYVTEYTATIPQNISGLDSYGICLYMSDYSLVWNTDQAEKFGITYLYTDA